MDDSPTCPTAAQGTGELNLASIRRNHRVLRGLLHSQMRDTRAYHYARSNEQSRTHQEVGIFLACLNGHGSAYRPLSRAAIRRRASKQFPMLALQACGDIILTNLSHRRRLPASTTPGSAKAVGEPDCRPAERIARIGRFGCIGSAEASSAVARRAVARAPEPASSVATLREIEFYDGGDGYDIL